VDNYFNFLLDFLLVFFCLKIYEALKLNQPNREIIIEYPDMVHGWVPRGDITNEKVLRDVDKALTDICNFLIEILN